MGANFSSGNNLFVYVDRPYYSPGDAVNGQVLLNCVQPFQTSGLVLKVEGYEQTSWREHHQETHSVNNQAGHHHAGASAGHNSATTHGTTHTHEVIHERRGKRELFKIRVPLQMYPHQVQPGQYQFPFCCVLPMNLPGSLEFMGRTSTSSGRRCTNVCGKIRYKVKAECEVPGMLKPNLRFKQIITLHERMAKPPSQIIMQDQKSVTACCCINKGYAHITAHVEKDSYFPGEVACAIVEIDNQSSVEFSAVALELHCTTRLQGDGGCVCENDEKLQSCKVPGVRAGEQQLKDGARRVSIPLPMQLLPSASGMLVQCHYTLEVKLKAPAHIKDPRVKLPITIYQSVPQTYQAYSAPPPYWQPQAVGHVVQVPMPSAPPMPPQGQVMGTPAQYPPPQYPPPQYPTPQYPPAQYPPAQYPPAQYPPGQNPLAQHPPAQNPDVSQQQPLYNGWQPQGNKQ